MSQQNVRHPEKKGPGQRKKVGHVHPTRNVLAGPPSPMKVARLERHEHGAEASVNCVEKVTSRVGGQTPEAPVVVTQRRKDAKLEEEEEEEEE